MQKNKPKLLENIPSKKGHKMGIFKCPYCINTFETTIRNVKIEHTKSCGCLRSKNLVKCDIHTVNQKLFYLKDGKA